MYNQPYFIPGYFASSAAPSMMRGAMNGSMADTRGAMGSAVMTGARLGAQGAGRGLGLFSRLGGSTQALKGINWGGLITNTSKTLNVVNQAIPLVRQVGPMVNNMKSMLKIASVFKDETDKKPIKQKKQTTNNSNNYTYNVSSNVSSSASYSNTTETREQTYYDDNYYDGSPTFFVNS